MKRTAPLLLLVLGLLLGTIPGLADGLSPGRPSSAGAETDPIASPLANAAQSTANTAAANAASALVGATNGSLVTDPAAWRAAISLGTAALLNSGTGSGAVPVLGASGLPAIGGALLTGVVASTAGALTANGANCSGNNFALGVDASGVGECAQPAFSNLSGSATDAQIPDSITVDLATLATTATTAAALSANPADCSAGEYATTIAASGDLACAAVAFSQLSGAATDAQVPNTITVDLASAATALASNPSDCSAGQYATTIASSGNLTCSQPAFSELSGAATDAQVPDSITVTLASTATALAANPSDCGAGTVATAIDASGALTCGYTVGTAANNLVQRDGSGNYPSGNGSAITALTLYTADSWPTDSWADPPSLPTGWAVDTTGADPDTAATYIAAGSGGAIQLVSDADGKAMISKTFAGMTTAATVWQARMEWKIANANSTGVDVPFTIRDGTKRLIIYPGVAGLRIEAGATDVGHGLANGDWATITVTRLGEGIYLHCGPHLVHVFLYSGLTADATSGGEIRLGNSTTGARTATIRSFYLNIGAVNDKPPEYLFRGTYSGRLLAP